MRWGPAEVSAFVNPVGRPMSSVVLLQVPCLLCAALLPSLATPHLQSAAALTVTCYMTRVTSLVLTHHCFGMHLAPDLRHLTFKLQQHLL